MAERIAGSSTQVVFKEPEDPKGKGAANEESANVIKFTLHAPEDVADFTRVPYTGPKSALKNVREILNFYSEEDDILSCSLQHAARKIPQIHGIDQLDEGAAMQMVKTQVASFKVFLNIGDMLPEKPVLVEGEFVMEEDAAILLQKALLIRYPNFGKAEAAPHRFAWELTQWIKEVERELGKEAPSQSSSSSSQEVSLLGFPIKKRETVLAKTAHSDPRSEEAAEFILERFLDAAQASREKYMKWAMIICLDGRTDDLAVELAEQRVQTAETIARHKREQEEGTHQVQLAVNALAVKQEKIENEHRASELQLSQEMNAVKIRERNLEISNNYLAGQVGSLTNQVHNLQGQVEHERNRNRRPWWKFW